MGPEENMPAGPGAIDVFRTERGEALVQAFIAALTGRDRDEAFALVRLPPRPARAEPDLFEGD